MELFITTKMLIAESLRTPDTYKPREAERVRVQSLRRGATALKTRMQRLESRGKILSMCACCRRRLKLYATAVPRTLMRFQRLLGF